MFKYLQFRDHFLCFLYALSITSQLHIPTSQRKYLTVFISSIIKAHMGQYYWTWIHLFWLCPKGAESLVVIYICHIDRSLILDMKKQFGIQIFYIRFTK